jgi:hypothetical protein
MLAQTKNKLSLLAIILLFLAPVIVAIVMNSNLINYHPSSMKNRGEFISPPINVTEIDNLKPYQDFWTIVYHHTGECLEECKNMLDLIYRVRLTKGHKMEKIKLLVLHPETQKPDIPAQYSSIETQSYQNNSEFSKTLAELSKTSLTNNTGLYILAPEGFIMMSYPKDFSPQDVIKDLGLLLRGRKGEE